MKYSKYKLHHARRLRKKAKNPVHREHPIAFFRYTSKNFWILLIPVIRGLIAYSFNIAEWMRVMWMDILIIAIFFFLAYFRRFTSNYIIKSDCFIYKSGFIAKRISSYPYSKISAVTVEKPLILYPFGCSYINIDTDAKTLGSKKTEPDIKLIMNDNDIAKIFEYSENVIKSDSKNVYKNHISKKTLIAFSILFSSAFSGVAIISAILINAGNIVGDKLESTVYNALNTAAETVNSKISFLISNIPTFTIALSLIIIISYFVSFFSNLLRHMNFEFEKRGESVRISDGFFTKRNYQINTSHINYADLRQNLLMKIFKVMSVNVNCSGYGKSKNEIPVFIPITNFGKVKNIFHRIFPELEWDAQTAPLSLKYIFIYIGPPTIVLNLISVAAGVLIYFFKEWYNMIFFTMIMLEIPILWMIIVKATAFATSGISYENNIMCIKYCKFYEFHTIVVPDNRIAKVQIKRSIFQRFNGSSDIIIFTNSEYTKSHRIRGLDCRSAAKIYNKYIERNI